MVAKKRGLGRGLDALLPKSQSRARVVEAPESNAVEAPGSTGDKLRDVPVEWIQPGRYQPRTNFDQESLEDLAESIKSQGIMQPIVLRAIGDERFEIIAGERRWRAAQLAGQEKVSSLIREIDDESALAMSLIENIQREDLNPLEEARALQRLIEEFDLTHQQVAEAVGRSRSGVTNVLRLTQLAPAVAQLLETGDLEMGHARALLALPRESQAEIGRVVASRGLNVRQTEALVRETTKPAPTKPAKPQGNADIRRLEETLSETIGQPVSIKQAGKGKGKLVITYNSLDELDGVLNRLGYSEN